MSELRSLPEWVRCRGMNPVTGDGPRDLRPSLEKSQRSDRKKSSSATRRFSSNGASGPLIGSFAARRDGNPAPRRGGRESGDRVEKVTLAYRDWPRLPAAENGTDEVVNGELRLVPTRLYPHAQIISNLNRCLGRMPENAAVYGSGIGLMISREPLTCRSPDIVVYWLEKMVIQDGLHWSAPGLIVEILSPSENRRRKEEKARRLRVHRRTRTNGDPGRRLASTLAICRRCHFRSRYLSRMNL
jgi:putative restriction endonuclease